MTTKDKFIKRLNSDSFKWLKKTIESRDYYSVDGFYNDAKRYVKAIKEGRVICSIGSVSRSGMSRTIKFVECSKNTRTGNYNFMNFYSLFHCLGYAQARNERDYFSISGCGMDMIFHTNYSNMHYMRSLGFINKVQCDHLCQQTPTVI
ncbi:MAG TPA: hypothetical protein ENH85_06965 [Candidatus Scalindua sp.]|nr:hypothetical protein [Candidatus Scalindua sp.]